MDDELWGNAWGSTTDTKSTTTKASESPKLTPAWPTKPIPTPGLSDGWGASSAWGASNPSVNLSETGGGWGDSLEYDTQAPEPVASYTESIVTLELKEEPEDEYEQVVHLSSVDHQADIPHSPLPTSPPPESHATTTDSRSSSPSHRFSTDDPTQDLPVTPRVAQAVVPSSPPRPDLDNNFGGFETGNDAQLRVTTGEEEDPWSPAPGDLTFPTSVHDASRVETDSVAGGDAWGSSWQPKDERQDDQPVDEWEQARIKKARRDRKVPPEVLSGYLTGWESVVSELYPDAPLPRSEPTTEWRSPMEDVSELQTLRKLYRLPILATTLSSPPPILSPLPPYSSLQIHSRQAAALKATRISAVSQLSPFAHLTSARSIQAAHRFSSKPSVSISKSSLDFGDGVVGVGWAWAHEEKKPEPKSTPAPVTIAPAPTVTASTPSPSPTPATPTGRFSGFWARARGSTDKSSVGQGSRSNTPVPLTSPSTSSLGEATNSTKLAEPPAAESSPAPAQPQPAEPSAPVPTSSVSRFFKRFSRSNTVESERSRLATSESVSLSAEDLEFLADSVPDTTEKSLLDGGRGITEFDALEAMLKSKPLPKEVPVLAPPPRITGSSSGTPSPLATVPEGHNAGEDDLWDIFGGPPNGHSNRSSLPALPRVAPAAASLTPKLTTPVSSAPASRSHTPRLPSIADLSTIVGGRGSHLRQTSFSGRPQQAFRSDVPSLDSPPVPSLPPPPGSMTVPSLMETDPFDDFMSAPAGPPGQTQSRTSFDDFGDFEFSAPVSMQALSISSPPPLTISSPSVTTSSVMSPPITFNSPSPPKPPSKTGTPVFVRTGANIHRVDTPPLAALPPLLPPAGRSNISTSNHSFTASSSFAIAPPPNPIPQPQINLFDFGSSPPKNVPVPAPSFTQTPKPTTTSSKGGLSASDLSFFEGL
ncbi:unnamed protein product [Rhizoctonia solani]|uniref:Uncharacterized protein n=1 Tax=Rhizoctonia solani TaxID=456999 RepID=A0A8H3HTF2_9AGAM|nr:unnamed protein product [Rhizoctonia solani]